jgi:hypothetical protein
VLLGDTDKTVGRSDLLLSPDCFRQAVESLQCKKENGASGTALHAFYRLITIFLLLMVLNLALTTFYFAALHPAAGQCACSTARIAARPSCLSGTAVHPAFRSGLLTR